MKEQKLYVCEFCGTQYKEKSKSIGLEKNHHTPKTMGNHNIMKQNVHKMGHPDRIEIVF